MGALCEVYLQKLKYFYDDSFLNLKNSTQNYLIYESFNLDKKVKNKGFSKILKGIGKNKNLNNYFIKLADTGINF